MSVVTTSMRLLLQNFHQERDLTVIHLRLVSSLTDAGVSHLTTAKVASGALELMRNAARHGSGQLSVSLSSLDGIPTLEVVVTDRGPGLPGTEKELPYRRYGTGLKWASEVFSELRVCNRADVGVQALGRLKLDASTLKGQHSPPLEGDDVARQARADCGGDTPPLSEIQRLQEQVDALSNECDQLAKAKLEAESLARARASFLATMSHEIRTPLNAIIGVSSVLMNGLVLQDQLDHFEVIRSSGEQLLDIINNILDFSKIEAGKVQLDCAPFDLRQCIEDAFDVAVKGVPDKRIKSAYSLPDDGPQRFSGDMARLRQVLVNLLSNAAKFTANGGEVQLAVTSEPTGDDAWRLHITVSDSGIGIAPDRISTLFNAFEQTDASTYRRFGGTGLGLAITISLIEAMGGHITVDSTPNVGTTFTIALELDSAPTESLSTTAAALRAAMAGKRAELHFQSSAVRASVEQHLQAFGVECRDAALRNGQAPDVIIAERELRHRAAQRHAAHPQSQRPPLIIVSETADCTDMEDIGLDVAGTAQMPVKRNALFSLLVSAMNLIDPKLDRRGPNRVADDKIAEKFPLSILLVEDNPVNQKVATLMMQRLGYTPSVASDGLEAIRQAELMDYDVILMDMRMPKLDGLEATRHIRKRATGGHRPIILATTADASESARSEFLAAGCNGMLLKPVRLSDLIRSLIRAHHALHPRRKRSASVLQGNTSRPV